MKKDLLEFEVSAREKKGRGQAGVSARQLRRENLTPAVVYGPVKKPVTLSLDVRLAEKYGTREYDNKIFTFKSSVPELNGLKVIRKDISYHKVTRKPLHIDFLALDMKKPVRIHVEVEFLGKAKGVKESGGVFNIIRRTIEVECLPEDIPESFSINIDPLDLNQNFHVSDLKIPSNIKLITSPKSSLCGVSEVAEEESKPTEQATTTAAPAGEEKKPEDKKEKA